MHRLSAILLAVACAAYAQAPAARIKIDIDRTVGELHPHVFGNFAEHLGRMIYGGLGTVDDARYWVEYTNESRHTYWANQRRKNGREAPYKVTYWGLGSELDGPWLLSHKNAEEYANRSTPISAISRTTSRTFSANRN